MICGAMTGFESIAPLYFEDTGLLQSWRSD